MFSEISELKTIREQKSRLSEREAELTQPMLTNLSMVEVLYEWFKEILAGRNCPPNIESVTQRKKFIFIVLYLYCPSALAGGKMVKGLREKLANVLGNIAPSVISDNVSNIVFFYQQYKNFRRDVEWAYSKIVSQLKSKGVIS
ncbi:hypothetical protein [Parabacteroides pacaensis]|uniref:hypothetical protein n=1 Tax=Parabacteroides pacaensis TaxID=2086575 RepID=UPI000D0FFA3E|nr:hypothetical protein [Parabacteroides pacaensis]